jgi:hypothetical protein
VRRPRDAELEKWREFGRDCERDPRGARRAFMIYLLFAFAGGGVFGSAGTIAALAVITW